ncbi:2-desacetyl-2-hydroxyethyl bacteriochlorophyllide A dehydrogenase [Pseudoclavibacter sp. JAI123]|uniref:L-idonate 5-dehydrogenase n=1 Tax=Pseudoclavibacter sp. JAI123 TaxID=2723065 RepID=UPI001836E835|nr:L-idonate 5-dehydrogenase [Pseudoclavibacter sp. JAI123]NYF12190.1 2-desacetyl-2-hydroxyethyl bacteriochlorophyllide A dehydrogenase [Pseudoclavibacter sp. JAI123]
MTQENLAVVAHGKDDLRLDVLPEPTPATDEAVVAIAYGGVCGSDLHYWMHGAAGESILRDPLVLGHEIVGTVLHAAADGSGPSVGQRVAVHPATPGDDGETPFPDDRPNLSPAGTYLGSAARIPHTQGAFARRVALPARMLRVLPDRLDLKLASLAEPAAVAWHGVGQAGEVRGKRVLVIGAGPIGALVVAVLKHHGAGEIIASDLHELPLAVATELGASRVVDARDADAIAAVHADVVIESSGTVPGLASAIRGAGRGGRVVLLGLQRSGEVPALLSLAITRELTLVGSFRFADEIDAVIDALADGSLVVDAVLTHEFPVEQALDAFAVAGDASRSSKVLLSFGPEDDGSPVERGAS